MFDIASRSRYDREIYAKLIGRLEAVPLEPAAARKLIEGAVEFAKGIGFPPHRDYAKAMRIFGDIDASASRERFRYGKDGKPFFISGPHDSPSRCNQIRQRLSDRCGPDGFHYIVAVPTEDLT
jgi:hypothetical protein